MAGLRWLGVSQCSGVTAELLMGLLPGLPTLTHLTFNCLHLASPHIDAMIKVLNTNGLQYIFYRLHCIIHRTWCELYIVSFHAVKNSQDKR